MTSSTTMTDLSTLALFENCEPADLERVREAVTATNKVAEGSVICSEGDSARTWWIVVEGMADVTVKGLYTATIGPGETIGELALLDNEPRNATVTATTEMILHEVNGDGFLDALSKSPHLSLALLRQLAVRLRHANDRQTGPARTVAPATPTPAPAAGLDASATPTRPVFDPFAPGYFANPYAQYAALRETDPVHYSTGSGAYFITRFEDVHRLTRNRELMVSIDFALPTPAIEMERARLTELHSPPTILQRDGDDHNRLRRLVTKVFTPRAIASWRDRADFIVEGLLADASERESIDVITDYALVLPAQVISEMLGMPHDDIPSLRRWSNALSKTLDPVISAEEQEAATKAGRAMGTYFKEVIDEKRRNPADDILTALVNAKDNDGALNTGELIVQVLTLYIAGHETTLNLIGNSVTHLFNAPDQLDLLRTDPGVDANAIEELLRFDSPVQFTRRIAADALEVGGVTIPAGSVVFLGLAAANHDPAKWGPTADAIDLSRVGANEHQSFGGGAHYCLGAALARLESQIAIPRLLRRFPRMTPAYDQPAWGPRMTLRGVERLPVTLR